MTGASTGIGQAIAVRLAREGHHVVLGARRQDRAAALAEQIRGAGGGADARRLDVTNPSDVAAAVDVAVSDHGGLDVLINNAGSCRCPAWPALLTEDWIA